MEKKIKNIYVAFDNDIKEFPIEARGFLINVEDINQLNFDDVYEKVFLIENQINIFKYFKKANISLKESANKVLTTINNKPYTVFDRFLEVQDIFEIDLYDENDKCIESYMFKKDSFNNLADNPFQKTKKIKNTLSIEYEQYPIEDQEALDEAYFDKYHPNNNL